MSDKQLNIIAFAGIVGFSVVCAMLMGMITEEAIFDLDFGIVIIAMINVIIITAGMTKHPEAFVALITYLVCYVPGVVQTSMFVMNVNTNNVTIRFLCEDEWKNGSHEEAVRLCTR